MKVLQRTIAVETGRAFTDVTAKLRELVAESGVVTGTCNVFIAHTSASLVIQENADPAVLRDLAAWMQRLAPVGDTYEHDDEGPDDMPAHLRSSVTRTSETIPISSGKLALGTWQALYVWEHRQKRHSRTLIVTILGE